MATFGSTVGTLDPSKDYLAQAIANSGQLVAGGIQQGAQGYVQGKQKQAEIKAAQEQKKLVMFQGEMEDANAEGLRLAQTQGADPAQVDAYLNQRKNEIRQKYGMIDGKPDNFAAINAPQQPQQQPPQAQPAPQQAETPQGAGGSFEGPQMTAPEPKQAPAQPPALQAPLTSANIFAGARENQQKSEQAKREAALLVDLHNNISGKYHVSPEDIKSDRIYSQFDVNTIEGARAIEAEAGRRFDERTAREGLARAKATGADAAARDAKKETAKEVPELDATTKAINKNVASLQGQYTNFKAQIERGDLIAARATAQSMQGLINSLNGQGAMGDAERQGLLGSIEAFANVSDPDQFRVGRDWEQMQRQFGDSLSSVDKARLQAHYDNGYTLSGKVRLYFPDGHSEAVEPGKAKALIRSGTAAYVGRWDSIDQVKRY